VRCILFNNEERESLINEYMMSSPKMTTLSLMQNSHNDGSAAALQVLLLFVISWEMTYRIVKYLMYQLLGKTNFTTNDANNSYDTSSRGRTLQTLLTCGPSYAVSTVHAIIVTARGCTHLLQLWDASPYDKFVIPPDSTTTLQDDNTMMNYRGAHLLVARTNIIFVSYLLYDVCHVLYQYPKLGKVDTVLHHILFIVCSFINGTYGIMAFAFGWLIVGEASTILLNVRWLLIQLSGRSSISSSSGGGGGGGGGISDGKSSSSSGSSGSGSTTVVLLDTINILFAITFLIVRVLIYTLGVVHLLIMHGRSIIMVLPQTTYVPRILLGITCGCILLGWGLNLIWGMKIMAMVFRKSEARKKSSNGKKD